MRLLAGCAGNGYRGWAASSCRRSSRKRGGCWARNAYWYAASNGLHYVRI